MATGEPLIILFLFYEVENYGIVNGYEEYRKHAIFFLEHSIF